MVAVAPIREMFASYFRQKCAVYAATAQYLLTYPEGSFAFARGEFAQAMSELCYAFADAFGGCTNEH